VWKPPCIFCLLKLYSYHLFHGPENSHRKSTETTVLTVPSEVGDLANIVGGVTEVERIVGTKDREGVLSPGARRPCY
jgi:hypothetical protein